MPEFNLPAVASSAGEAALSSSPIGTNGEVAWGSSAPEVEYGLYESFEDTDLSDWSFTTESHWSVTNTVAFDESAALMFESGGDGSTAKRTFQDEKYRSGAVGFYTSGTGTSQFRFARMRVEVDGTTPRIYSDNGKFEIDPGFTLSPGEWYEFRFVNLRYRDEVSGDGLFDFEGYDANGNLLGAVRDISTNGWLYQFQLFEWWATNSGPMYADLIRVPHPDHTEVNA